MAVAVKKISSFSIPAAMRALEEKYFPNGVLPEQIEFLDEVRSMLNDSFRAGFSAAHGAGTEEWSNNACLGYVILGAKAAGMTDAQTKEIVRAVYCQFDQVSVEEAKDAYIRSPY